MALDELRTGESGVVTGLLACGSMRRRLIELGLVRGTLIECVGRSPLGDPAAYRVRGAIIALRREDSRGILISV